MFDGFIPSRQNITVVLGRALGSGPRGRFRWFKSSFSTPTIFPDNSELHSRYREISVFGSQSGKMAFSWNIQNHTFSMQVIYQQNLSRSPLIETYEKTSNWERAKRTRKFIPTKRFLPKLSFNYLSSISD